MIRIIIASHPAVRSHRPFSHDQCNPHRHAMMRLARSLLKLGTAYRAHCPALTVQRRSGADGAHDAANRGASAGDVCCDTACRCGSGAAGRILQLQSAELHHDVRQTVRADRAARVERQGRLERVDGRATRVAGAGTGELKLAVEVV